MIGTQVKRLARHTLTYGVGQVLNRFLTFLLLPVFTAYLSPQDYGIMAILGLLSFVLMPIFSLGFGSALGVCYFEKDDRERKDHTIWTAVTILLLSAMVLGVAAVFLPRSVSLLAFQTPEYDVLVRITLFSMCLGIVIEPFMMYLRFEEKSGLFVFLTVVTTLTTIGLSVFMVVVLQHGVRGMVVAGLISRLVTTPLYFIVIGPRIARGWSRSVSRELLRLGLPLIPAFAFLFIIRQFNKYILQWSHGLHDVGIYNIGFSLGMVMDLLATAFTTAWYPYFMSFMERKDEARKLFGHILTYYVFAFGGLCILFFVFAKPVVLLMTQPPFHGAYRIVGLAASAQFVTGVFSILLAGMYFAKEVKYQSLVQGAAAVISVLLNLWLIRYWGEMGAAVGLLGGTLSMVILQHLWNLKRKYLDIQYEWGRVFSVALVAVPFAVFSLWERTLPLSAEWGLAIAESAVLLVVLWMLLHRNEKDAIRAMMPFPQDSRA